MSDNKTASSLGVRTLTGAGWVIVWRMSTRLLGILNTIVLVRLLVPADFGLLALATTFAHMVESLSAIGVAEAIVREKETDRALYDTGFTLNLLRGLTMCLFVAACSWPVAAFFGDPRLFEIQLVLAATILLAACENIGVVEFRRNLAFDQEFKLALVPRVAGILVSIAIALMFQNYWALVAGIVTNRVLRVLASYWFHPYRPALTLRAWRRLIGFSFWIWVTTLVMAFRDRMDTLVVGRVLGPVKTGIYAVGHEIGSLTSTELVEPLTIALFAGFSAGRRDGTDVADGYLRAIAATLLLILPMGVGLAMLALPLISLLFGAAWLEAVPLVQMFGLVATVKVFAYFSGVLLNAHGLLSVIFQIMLVSVLTRAALLAVLIVPFGLIGAAAGAVCCTLLEEVLFMTYCFRRFNLRPRDLMRGIWRCVLAAGAMAAALWWLDFGHASAVANQAAAVRDLIGGTVTGAVVYTAVLLALWLLSRRPDGAEAVFLTIIGNTARHYLGRYAGRRA